MNSEFNFMSLMVTFFCTTKFLTPSITNLELFDNKLEKVLNRKNRKKPQKSIFFTQNNTTN